MDRIGGYLFYQLTMHILNGQKLHFVTLDSRESVLCTHVISHSPIEKSFNLFCLYYIVGDVYKDLTYVCGLSRE